MSAAEPLGEAFAQPLPDLPLPDPPRPARDAAAPLSLIRAMSEARQAVALFTELPVDAVVSCTRADPGWQVLVDVVETRARMGDNDMLASYLVEMTPAGEVTGYRRTGRYRREDAARGQGGAA